MHVGDIIVEKDLFEEHTTLVEAFSTHRPIYEIIAISEYNEFTFVKLRNIITNKFSEIPLFFLTTERYYKNYGPQHKRDLEVLKLLYGKS